MTNRKLIVDLVAAAAPVFIGKALKYASAGECPSNDDIISEVMAECESGDDAGSYGDLVTAINTAIEDIIEDIKTEMRMEIYMRGAAKSEPAVAKVPIGGIMDFEVTDDTKIEGLMSGYSALQKNIMVGSANSRDITCSQDDLPADPNINIEPNDLWNKMFASEWGKKSKNL